MSVRALNGLIIFAVCLLGTGCMAIPFLPSPGVGVDHIVYSSPPGSRPLRADIYRQKNKGVMPGILLLHGGGLKGTGGKWHMHALAQKLAKRGFAVMNVSYRALPDYKYPVPEEDVKAALHWMRENASQHGIDRHRIAVFGYSAGGYLGSLVALKDDARQDRVKAIVAGGAPSDLVFYARGNLVPDYLGGRLEEVPELYYEASPANFVTHDSPPIFMYHGTEDRMVRPEHPLEMLQAYQSAGAKAEVRWIPGLGHLATFAFSSKVVDEAADFLDREMK